MYNIFVMYIRSCTVGLFLGFVRVRRNCLDVYCDSNPSPLLFSKRATRRSGMIAYLPA